MTAKEIIKKYELFESDGKLGIPAYSMEAVKQANMLEEIKARKEEILAEIQSAADKRKLEAKERQEKIDAIDGLKEIESLQRAWAEYHRKFNEMMDDEYNDGVNPPVCPQKKTEDLLEKYPTAAAYLKAKSYADAAHFKKSAAGSKAIERIINGEDPKKALADMEAEWKEYCDKHMWD